MDIQTLSNVINNFLRDVNKDLKIQKLVVTQEKLYVEYEPQEIKIVDEPVVAPKKIDKNASRQKALRIARSRVRDPRVKAILEANPTMTFAEWVEKEYPDVRITTVHSALSRHPELPVRKCIDLLRARS